MFIKRSHMSADVFLSRLGAPSTPPTPPPPWDLRSQTSRTSNSPHETMMTTKFSRDSPALRMAVELSAKRFKFFWRPGHQNRVPDTLGRVLTTVESRAAEKMYGLISLKAETARLALLSGEVRGPPQQESSPSVVPHLYTLATQAVEQGALTLATSCGDDMDGGDDGDFWPSRDVSMATLINPSSDPNSTKIGRV